LAYHSLLKVGEVKFAPAGIGRSLVQFRAGAEDDRLH
jgi:hypothetical protein